MKHRPYLKRQYWKRVINNNWDSLRGLFLKKRYEPKNSGSVNILIFNWRDTKHVWAGGAETYIHEIAKRWVKTGYDVTLFCGNDNRSSRNDVIDGVRIIRRGGHYTVYFWGLLYYLLRFRNRYDIIIDSENGIPFFTPLFVKKPIILLIHHIHQEVFLAHLPFPLSVIALFLETKLMPYVYRNRPVITVSVSSKNAIAKLRFVDEEQITIVTPGINAHKFKKMRKSISPTMVYVGRLKPYKNIDVAIRAFSSVIKEYKNAHFTIIGEGESKKKLERLVSKLSLNQHVTFLGKAPEELKMTLLAQSWMLVQPSMIEGFGITVLEANASGTPVIASDVKGLCDSVVKGKTGILCKPKDTEAFAEAMKLLIRDTSYTRGLGKAAFEWAHTFSWDKSSDIFLTVVHQQLEQQATVPAARLALSKVKNI